MLLAFIINVLFYVAAMTFGGVNVYWSSPYAFIIPFTIWWFLALAIAWPLAARWHLRPF
jgi:hypothetical protein